MGGRSEPRYTGPAVVHDVTFSDADPRIPGYRPGAQAVSCTCGWHTVIDGGHSDEDRQRLARQHAGTEDP